MSFYNDNGYDKDEIVSLSIGGQDVRNKSQFPVTNPKDGGHLWCYTSATLEEVDQTCQAAETAFIEWSQTNPRRRIEVLLKAADLFRERQSHLFGYMKSETAAQDEFINFNISATIAQLTDIAHRAITICGTFPSVEDDGRSALVLKEPYGVVLGIAPWNAPYILGSRAIAAALVTGNTVILKGSELAPRCFRAIIDIFNDAGLPSGCASLLLAAPQHAAEVTNALIKHPAVAKITFTGSGAVGSIIASTAGKYLKPVLLELGGKASAIVFGDADLEKAAKACIDGSFLHSGQVCMGTERILVQSSVAASFGTQLQQAFKEMHGSNNPGPVLISATATNKVQGLIDNALARGASVLCEHEGQPNGSSKSARSLPVVLSNVNKEMDLYYTESFGPVATLHTFDTEEEALAIANDTEYGLAGAIFTENLSRGLRVAKKYTTGAVHINAMSIHDEAVLPHGGVKSSGFGRFNAEQGLNEFCRTKVITWQN